MSALQSIIEKAVLIYRRTLKRSRHLHSLLYAITRVTLVPLMEKITGFYTMKDGPLLSCRIAQITGTYERETVRVVKEFVKLDMTVLDLGAHVGYYSIMCSKLVGNKGRVIAFEPHPLTFDVLCKNLRALKNVTPVQLAVTDQEGSAVLHDAYWGAETSSLQYDEYKRNWLKSHLPGREIFPRVQNEFPHAKYPVKTTTVDSYLTEASIEKVDFIKMDIEGAEMNAIQGMKRTIKSSPHLSLIMEFNPRALQSFGVDPTEALEELRQLGPFKVMVIEDNGELSAVENGGVTPQLMDALMERIARVNLLCVKKA